MLEENLKTGFKSSHNYRFRFVSFTSGGTLKTIQKSAKLANVLYDIRGPIMDAARQMEDEGQKIIKLNAIHIKNLWCLIHQIISPSVLVVSYFIINF